MNIDVLVAEIGSTTTVVSAFNGIGESPVFIGQGHSPTTVLAGDVRDGLGGAIANLARNLHEKSKNGSLHPSCLFPYRLPEKMGTPTIEYGKMLAASSAAGGLRMSVHGLVYDMTVRAGKEAALGAGANIHMTTAGLLEPIDITQLESLNPNLILLAGGTDYGERDTAVKNALSIAESTVTAPVIYCGNIQNIERIKLIFGQAGKKLYITENVYPRLDDLNVEPVRRLIHKAFEEHITEAPGMKHVRKMVTGSIIPTPGAVMECAKMLKELIGDLLVVDVGGATTDVHSATEGSEEVQRLQISPEPIAKRTVEGDLGVYVNAEPLCTQIGLDKLESILALDVENVLRNYKPIPETEEQLRLTTFLAEYAATNAIKRHAGRYRHTFTASGRRTWAEGKDLTRVKWLVATGGALTRLPTRNMVLEKLTFLNENNELLYPQSGSLKVIEDRNYCMAALGVLYRDYPEDAKKLAYEFFRR